MSDDQFYDSEEEKENSSSDANLALVIIICFLIGATIYVASL